MFFGFNSYGPVVYNQSKWKSNKTPYYMVYKNEEFWQNGKNSNLAIICLIGYHYGSKYTQTYGKSIQMGMGMPK